MTLLRALSQHFLERTEENLEYLNQDGSLTGRLAAPE